MTDPILDVDLPAFETGGPGARRAVVDGVMRSLATGFVFCGHDLSATLLDDTYSMLGLFFSMDQDSKQTAAAPRSHGQRGYTGVLVETAARADLADWKEMLNWGSTVVSNHPLSVRFAHRYAPNVFPEDLVPGITAALEELHRQLLDLQRRFLRVVSTGLGCDPQLFDGMVTDGATLSRAIHYPAMHSAPQGGHVWAGAHGDINLTTALPRATAPGLQVLTEQGWVDARPPDDHVILNTGMMLEHFTNGLIPTGVHRVVAEGDDDTERLSVVQFCHPTPWTVLAPLSTCITPQNPQRFAPIAASDRFDEVLWQINLVDRD